MPEKLIDVVGPDGHKTQISEARLKRYPSLAATFRPVSEKRTAPAVIETPAGDNQKETTP